MTIRKLALLGGAIAMFGTAQPVLADETSNYLRCDGNPNNMSAGEGIARFVGAVTLLGLFAPAPESPDPEARKFAAEGVAACTALIEGEKAEGNVARRLPLILARAIHQIEAKNYPAALADIELARTQAKTAKLDGDIYFDRSFGQSIDRLEAETLVRMGRVDEANASLMRKASNYPHSAFVLGAIPDYFQLGAQVTDEQITWLRNLTRIDHTNFWVYSARLQMAGRWQEAATANEQYLDYVSKLGFDETSSESLAVTAVVHWIAGNREKGIEFADRARANFDDRNSRGVGDSEPSRVIAILDFFNILRLAEEGDIAKARLLYGARSEWTGIVFAQKLHAMKLLREGADESELMGALSRSPEELIEKRTEQRLARMLQEDTDNKTLFNKILPYANVEDFEKASKRVWRTPKTKLFKKDSEKAFRMRQIQVFQYEWQVQVDAMLLHSALMAKEQGDEGFVFWMDSSNTIYGFTRFGNRGDEGLSDLMFFDADEVIAELSRAIPDPEQLRLRKRQRSRR